MAILRIGVGDFAPKQEGYVNLDVRDLPNIDVVADARSLPFEDETFDSIESRNLIEHFDRNEIDGVFKEWARVLKKKGLLAIETVDGGNTMRYWEDIPTENLLDALLGQQTYPENYHKMLFTEQILRDKLTEAGFKVKQVENFVYRLIPRIVIRVVKK